MKTMRAPRGCKNVRANQKSCDRAERMVFKKKHIGSVKLPAPLCHRFKGDGDLDASKRDGLRLLFMQQQQQQQMCARVACFSSGIRQQHEILSFYLFKKTKKGKTKVCSLFCSVFNCGENLNCCRIFLNICQ